MRPESTYRQILSSRWRDGLVWLVLLLSVHAVSAQHVSQYSLYTYERYGFNPAFGGMERSLAASLQYRAQWAGLTGHPESKLLNVNLPVYRWAGAAGMQVYNEQVGAESQSGVSLSYNYIGETHIGLFSAGLRAGILNVTLDGTKLRAPDGIYEGAIIDHQDEHLPNGKVSGVAPLVDAGVYFAGNFFEAGLSMTGYFPAGIRVGEDTKYHPKAAFHFFGEYFIESWETVSLYPTVYLKSDLTQTQAEIAVRAEWQHLLSATIGYRGFGRNSVDALILSAGVRLSSKFFLYYAYDIGLSGLKVAHEGTHEILIRYNLGQRIGAGLIPRVIYNPRDL